MKYCMYLMIILLISGCTKQDTPSSNDTEMSIENETALDEELVLENDVIEPDAPELPEPYRMYINSLEGLRVRDVPSLEGNRVALLADLTEVLVLTEGSDIVTIDGIHNRWMYIESGAIEGWVFGGYLSEEKVNKVPEPPLKMYQIIDSEPFIYKYPKGSRGHIGMRFDIENILYANGIFVATGNAWANSSIGDHNGYLLYSTDGVTWNVVDNTWDSSFDAVVYGNGMFLAAGSHDEIVYSYNGIEWFTNKTEYPGAWELVYGNGKFVTWTSRIPEYSDDGARQSFYGLAYSEDGTNWEFLPASNISENAGDAYCITYTNGRFYVVLEDYNSGDTTKIASSTDLETWIVMEGFFGSFDSSISHSVRSIVYGNGRLLVFSCVAIDEYTDGGVNLAYSDDGGTTWQSEHIAYNDWSWINEITFANGYFIAVGNNQKAAYSRDGITWTHVDDTNNYNTYNQIHYRTSAYGGGYHIMAGTEGMIRVSQWTDHLQ